MFEVTPADETATISKLFISGSESDTEVEKNGGSNWSVSGGLTATIKKEYLATLEEAEGMEMYFQMSDGTEAAFTLDIVDTTPEAPGGDT